MNIIIQKLEAIDVPLAHELFFFFQEDDADETLTRTSDDYLRNLLSREDFHVLIARHNERIVGGLTAYELPMYKEELNELFLYEIGVEDSYRKKGIAKNLIEALIKIGQAKRIREMYVGAMADNVPAIKLYTSTGGKAAQVAWFEYRI